MSIKLPKLIENYFSADSDAGNDIAELFAKNAIVIDEKQTYNGQDAIRKWKSDVTTKFTYESVPFACENLDSKTVVTSKLTGDFPGSPIDLRYFFGLEEDKIAYLEIKP
ncbi:polyketide cyclase [Pseudohongiella nitratireducens]|jgi:predicted Holliday junction resolvase-like endonuclease|uniref:Polyketide cyclase n=1 Tax=Pseudohongiella nitratireducens TaxID=1768907 RepID=A0A916VJN6_9GAMM|nr:polyketide cyclase [Pseudohongiella nitratireducens]GFZ79072.1 polyketide cyclase [Pseudohongiella nitratireducens]